MKLSNCNIYYVYLISKKLNEKGWTIVMRNGRSCINPQTKEVYIDKKHSEDVALTVMLHELGHVLLWSSSKYKQKYNLGYVQSRNSKVNKTVVHRLKILEEEIEAWNIGENFAIKNGIFESKGTKFTKSFNVQRTRCLMTYARWLTEKNS